MWGATAGLANNSDLLVGTEFAGLCILPVFGCISRRLGVVQRALVEYHPLIRDLPQEERPRERLRDFGPNSLSTAELLAIILRTGARAESVVNLSARLLMHYGGLGGLMRATFDDLCHIHGLGEAKVAQLKAALELSTRVLREDVQAMSYVKSPRDVANLLMVEMGYLEQEHLRTVLLSTKNQVIATPEVYKGSVNSSLIRVGEVFRDAVRHNAAAIIVVHNHPSGDPTPSPEDIRVTTEIAKAGKLLDIEVLDHLIIGQQRFVSLKERGLGFP
ncbi:MAG: DNA repair protein RadC [Chloroflexi bacterium]|nr:DNA repair protein RadC [Chloroflexota bacterium]